MFVWLRRGLHDFSPFGVCFFSCDVAVDVGVDSELFEVLVEVDGAVFSGHALFSEVDVEGVSETVGAGVFASHFLGGFGEECECPAS